MENLYSFWIPVVTLVLLFIGLSYEGVKRYRRMATKQNTKVDFLQEITNPRTGMVRLTVRDLEKFEVPVGEPYAFPLSLTPYLQKLNAIEIADILFKSDERNYDDICRVVTIASALYSFEIPLCIFKLDDQTLSLYRDFRYTYELTDIPRGDLKPRLPKHPKREVEILSVKPYEELYPTIGRALMYATSTGEYVSFTAYAVYVNRMNTAPLSRKLSHDEIRAVTTAFAAKFGVLIPKAYVEFDSLALELIKRFSGGTSSNGVAKVVELKAFRERIANAE